MISGCLGVPQIVLRFLPFHFWQTIYSRPLVYLVRVEARQGKSLTENEIESYGFCAQRRRCSIVDLQMTDMSLKDLSQTNNACNDQKKVYWVTRQDVAQEEEGH